MPCPLTAFIDPAIGAVSTSAAMARLPAPRADRAPTREARRALPRGGRDENGSGNGRVMLPP